jgi:hypothetical protein
MGRPYSKRLPLQPRASRLRVRSSVLELVAARPTGTRRLNPGWIGQRPAAAAHVECCNSCRRRSLYSGDVCFGCARVERCAMLLTIAFFALLCASVIGFFWVRGRRGRDHVLPDPRVSTLVFPPESKFRPSVLPPHDPKGAGKTAAIGQKQPSGLGTS